MFNIPKKTQNEINEYLLEWKSGTVTLERWKEFKGISLKDIVCKHLKDYEDDNSVKPFDTANKLFNLHVYLNIYSGIIDAFIRKKEHERKITAAVITNKIPEFINEVNSLPDNLIIMLGIRDQDEMRQKLALLNNGNPFFSYNHYDIHHDECLDRAIAIWNFYQLATKYNDARKSELSNTEWILFYVEEFEQFLSKLSTAEFIPMQLYYSGLQNSYIDFTGLMEIIQRCLSQKNKVAFYKYYSKRIKDEQDRFKDNCTLGNSFLNNGNLTLDMLLNDDNEDSSAYRDIVSLFSQELQKLNPKAISLKHCISMHYLDLFAEYFSQKMNECENYPDVNEDFTKHSFQLTMSKEELESFITAVYQKPEYKFVSDKSKLVEVLLSKSIEGSVRIEKNMGAFCYFLHLLENHMIREIRDFHSFEGVFYNIRKEVKVTLKHNNYDIHVKKIQNEKSMKNNKGAVYKYLNEIYQKCIIEKKPDNKK